MKIGLWIAQGLLAAVFVLHGFVLLNPPPEMLASFEGLPFSRGFMGFIGIVEVLGAVGLILPRALNVFTFLTPLAAVGLAIIMFGAVGTHLMQGDVVGALPSLVLALICASTAYLTMPRRP